MSNRRLGTNEARWLWKAISRGFTPRSACRSQAKTCHLVLRGTAFAHKEYKKYLQLIHTSIGFPAMVTSSDFLRLKHKGKVVKLGCTDPKLQPQRDRINMGTQDPKKQNL